MRTTRTWRDYPRRARPLR